MVVIGDEEYARFGVGADAARCRLQPSKKRQRLWEMRLQQGQQPVRSGREEDNRVGGHLDGPLRRRRRAAGGLAAPSTNWEI
ncbi:hypothetical protein GQ602_001308 [Ophiocordyceps camponoti-floridani]|uniref:Uncharacterized protein n=1 Tax=Ophiocordyceps camponoti-floridani TaxID=2030778 RepID=A0A8H4VHA8_9HYPO|nr:hypothetical protein GQ602_001308 [Ophiocordyceps camponoti-floridani]